MSRWLAGHRTREREGEGGRVVAHLLLYIPGQPQPCVTLQDVKRKVNNHNTSSKISNTTFFSFFLQFPKLHFPSMFLKHYLFLLSLRLYISWFCQKKAFDRTPLLRHSPPNLDLLNGRSIHRSSAMVPLSLGTMRDSLSLFLPS